MDRFKELTAFATTATRGSLSAAARLEGVTPAIIGRRIDGLEERLGVRLLTRSTRRLTLTQEGQSFLEDCQRILNDLANAEASVSLGGIKASGHLRITAPAGFGRKHVAPLVMDFLQTHPEVTASMDLSDRSVDLINEGIDCAVRIGDLVDSSLVGVRLGEMRRVVVASQAYLQRHGVPRTLDDLASHRCLSLVNQGGWDFKDPTRPERLLNLKVSGPLECNDGAVLHEWALAGMGLAWRSLWEVGADLRWGRLVSVLDEWAPPPVGIHAVVPQRRHLPLRVRLFIELLKENYGRSDYWDRAE
jgi:DNA-binding transcriptional LysR family regulator